MKTHFIKPAAVIATSLAILCLLSSRSLAQNAAREGSKVSLSPDESLVSAVATVTNTLGVVSARTNTYVELATGLHYLDNGQWKQSEDRIELMPDGSAVASHGPHKVKFASDLYTDGAIDMTTPDGKHLRSHILGLGYYDTASGDVQIFALAQHSTGILVGTNQMYYTNAFDAVRSDVRYTYRKSGFEQDVILREQPPSPTNFNMSVESVRLVVFTEFLNPPIPIRSTNTLPGTDMTDENLDFGKTKIAPGKAFPLGNTSRRVGGVPTGKSWITVQGRTFLIEEVKYKTVEQELQNLPPQSGLFKGRDSKAARTAKNLRGRNRSSALQKLVAFRSKPSPKSKAPAPIVRLANIEPAQNGFVLDYESVTYTENFTFNANVTYFLSSGVNLSGTTTLEPGAIIKRHDNSGGITMSGPLVCNGTTDFPTIYTDWQDDTVGTKINGSGGSPSMNYSPCLYAADFYSSSPWQLNNLRVSYGLVGFWADDNNDVVARNCQFLNMASYGIEATVGSIALYNVLFADCDSALYSTANVAAQNVTAVNCTYAFWANASGGDFTGANNLFADVSQYTDGYLNDYLTDSSGLVSASGVFASVGGVGSYYYLANGTYRDIGTTSIDSQLLSDVQGRTTIAPPSSTADTSNPDYGFHYPIMRDWDVDGLDDAWEIANFGNLTQFGGDDYDGDGLTNLQEFQNNTNPRNADSDGQLHVFTPLK
jgi:hypothetical protein